MILSTDANSAVFIGTIDNALDDAIERKFRRFEPPRTGLPLDAAAWWTNVLSTDIQDAYAAETPTDTQKQILADERKAIASLSGSAKGMAGAGRSTNVAISSLLATGRWYDKHPFDAGAVRASGHHALHGETYAWAHACNNRDEAKGSSARRPERLFLGRPTATKSTRATPRGRPVIGRWSSSSRTRRTTRGASRPRR